MATAQQRGVGAIKVWLIIFAALWLVSTVFLIMLYTGQEELRDENEALRTAKARMVGPDEENRIALVRNVVDGGPTAVGQLEAARSQTALLATGDPNHDVATVRTHRDELLKTIREEALVGSAEDFRDVSLLESLTTLYQAFKKENELRRAAEERMAELEAEVTALVQATTDRKNDFDRRARELSERHAALERDHVQYREERDQAVAKLEADFEAHRAQADAELTDQRRRRAQAEGHLAEMQQRVAAQQEKFGALMIGPKELSTARQPDGRILTAIPGDDIVYIDLGRSDRLTLGLQFAVYSARTGIPADGRSKAQIEVVSISDASAECKIVRLTGSEIVLEDDLIANPIYDASRAPSFAVLGAFDLNRDGIPDPAGAAAIESMITDWGGVVVTEMSALTDFVVIGAAPRRPAKISDPTPEQRQRAESMQRLWDRYMDDVQTAKSLSVPVMTQDVFLNFLGYTSRFAGR